MCTTTQILIERNNFIVSGTNELLFVWKYRFRFENCQWNENTQVIFIS